MTTWTRPGMTTMSLAATVTTALLLGGCNKLGDHDETASLRPDIRSSSVTVDRQQFLHTWPFTIDSVTLTCLPGDRLIATDPDGHQYALNDKARADGLPGAEVIQNGEKPNGAVTSYGMGTCEFTQEPPGQ